MAKFITQRTEDEEVLFALFGNTLDGKDKGSTYLVKEGETIEGVLTAVKESPTYKKIYMLKVKGVEKQVLVLGKTDLVDQMGHGNLVTDLVAEVNDIVRITFINKSKTQKNYDWYNFEVAISKA